MALKVSPPYETWSEVLEKTAGLSSGLQQLYENQYGGSPRNIADVGMDLLVSSSSFGRSLYQVAWPLRDLERESLSIEGDYLAVTAAEAVAAAFRFREGTTDIQPTPAEWGQLLDSLAEKPVFHFYWLGRHTPLHAFAYGLWGHLQTTGRGIGELIELGSDSAGDSVLKSAAELTAHCLSLAASVRLGMDRTYPGRGGAESHSAQ